MTKWIFCITSIRFPMNEEARIVPLRNPANYFKLKNAYLLTKNINSQPHLLQMFLSKRTECDKVFLFAVLQGGTGGSVPYLVIKFSKAEPEIWISLVGADTNRLREEWEERSRSRSRAKSWGACSWAPRLHPTRFLWEPENCTLQPLGRNRNYATFCLIYVPFG